MINAHSELLCSVLPERTTLQRWYHCPAGSCLSSTTHAGSRALFPTQDLRVTLSYDQSICTPALPANPKLQSHHRLCTLPCLCPSGGLPALLHPLQVPKCVRSHADFSFVASLTLTLPSTILSGSWCCCLVASLCLTLCDPMDCSTPGFPVPHHLLEFAQVCAHQISDAIQPLHPLSPLLLPSILAQHQGLFQ